MNKLAALLIALSIFSINLYSQNIEIDVAVAGNYGGNYDTLPAASESLKGAASYYSGLIKINRGNNISSNRTKNKTIYEFYKTVNFDFNMLGRNEMAVQEFLDNSFYSTLNIFNKNVVPYKIIEKEGYKLCIAGISDGYDINGIKMLDYENELKKLIRKIGSDIDFLFVVSDLTRAENMVLLNKFPEVAVLFESGYSSSTEIPIRTEYGYIVPANGDYVLEMIYSDKISKKWKENSENSRLKSAYIKNYDTIMKFNGDSKENPELSAVKTGVEKELAEEMKEIAGYNKEGFYREETLFKEKIGFIEDVNSGIMRYYDADYTIFPAKNIKKELKKGLYTKLEIENFFSNDRIVICEMSKNEIARVKESFESSKGKDSRIYASMSYRTLPQSKYIVAVAENCMPMLKESEIKIVYRTNLTMNSFIPRGNHEKK